jgi:hypothetical protein
LSCPVGHRLGKTGAVRVSNFQSRCITLLLGQSILIAVGDPIYVRFARNSDRRAAFGSPSGAFILRKGRWKYHEYVGFESELFDLDSDPDEAANLANDPSYSAYVGDLRSDLNGLSIPRRQTARLSPTNASLLSHSADARLHFGWVPRARRPAPSA